MKRIAIVFLVCSTVSIAVVPDFIKLGSRYQFFLSPSAAPLSASVISIDATGWIEVVTMDAGEKMWLNVPAIQAVKPVDLGNSKSIQTKSAGKKVTTPNIGILGIDAHWSEYGEYMQELLEIVQIQWHKILDENRIAPGRGVHVSVTFKLNSKGEADVVKIEDSGAGKVGVSACQNAIMSRQPFRKWSSQMISVLGEEQYITLNFYYP